MSGGKHLLISVPFKTPTVQCRQQKFSVINQNVSDLVRFFISCNAIRAV